jgi:hypothetical protein
MIHSEVKGAGQISPAPTINLILFQPVSITPHPDPLPSRGEGKRKEGHYVVIDKVVPHGGD